MHLLFVVFLLFCVWLSCLEGNSGVTYGNHASSIGPIETSKSSHSLAEDALFTKYKKRFVCCNVPQYPNCDLYLCGTLHVAKTSSAMVQEVIQVIKPHYVVLELCESRIDSLYELEMNENVANITLSSVLVMAIEERSFKTLGLGLLSWMQIKAAKAMGSTLGGEQAMAAKEGAILKSTIVLGDRLYGVTIQRIFDKLRFVEKMKMVVLLLWEVITMSVFKLKDYIQKTETDDDFIKDEIARFGKHLPTFAKIIVGERDQYLAQTLLEIARVGFNSGPNRIPNQALQASRPRGRILAVVGAAHLAGVQKYLNEGGSSEEYISEISSSTRHNATWPGRGMLQVVNSQALFGNSGVV